MKMLFAILLGLLLLMSCASENGDKEETPSSVPAADVAIPSVQIETSQNEDGSWGYSISLDGKGFIHQPHKPAMGGSEGFMTEAQARKVAELVADKIGRGIMPPSISVAEVDSLIRLYQ